MTGKTLSRLLLTLGLMTVLFPQQGDAQSSFIARNSMLVVEDPGETGAMEVLWKSRAGAKDFWCAAGDYARRRLGASANDRVYLVRGNGPSQVVSNRRGAAFTIVERAEFQGGQRAGDAGNYSLSLSTPGFNIRVAHAQSFCKDSRRNMRRIGLF